MSIIKKHMLLLLIAVLLVILSATAALAQSITATSGERELASPSPQHVSSALLVNNTEQEVPAIIRPHITILSAEDELPPRSYINNSAAELYAEPGNAASLICSPSEGELCLILQPYFAGSYHQVLYKEQVGYIHALDVTPADELAYAFSAGQDMRITTNYTAEQLEECLQRGLAGLGECFAQAEQTYGVNALFLIAICQEESAHGTSGLAIANNNLAGLRGGSGWRSFASFADCVDYLANMLAKYYLAADGAFYRGSSISGVSQVYCGGSSHWVSNISKYIQQNQAAIEAAASEI